MKRAIRVMLRARTTNPFKEEANEATSFERQVVSHRTLRAGARHIGGVSLGAGTIRDAGLGSCSLYRYRPRHRGQPASAAVLHYQQWFDQWCDDQPRRQPACRSLV